MYHMCIIIAENSQNIKHYRVYLPGENRVATLKTRPSCTKHFPGLITLSRQQKTELFPTRFLISVRTKII